MSRGAQGLRAWLLQRVSAVYLAVFLGYALVTMLYAPPSGHEQWRAWLAQPAVGVAGALFVLAVLVHAWVGMRDVLMDYVHPTGLRVVLLALLGLVLVSSGLWALRLLMLAAV